MTPMINPLAGTGMHGGIQRIHDTGTDRVQINIGHGGENRPLVTEELASETAFPEASRTVVFTIGTSRNRLGQATHEPGQAT